MNRFLLRGVVVLLWTIPLCSFAYTQQNSSETIFFNSNAEIINKEDSNNASYYRIINYKDGKLYGAVKDYYKNGKILMVGYYSNNIGKGYENGQFTWYYVNGVVFQTCSYINGLLDGPYVECYPSGLKKASVAYSMGNRYGCEYAWNENGALIHKGFFANDSLFQSQDCDTNMSDQKIGTRNGKDLEPQPPNKDCEKKNTGDYCFTNSTKYSVVVTLYIPAEATGTYLQLDRFNNISIRWSTQSFIGPGKTNCFTNIESTQIGYMIKEEGSFSASSIYFIGDIKVEKCQSKTYSIKEQQ